MITLYNTLIWQPLYNGFIFLFDAFPWMDAGLAVIVFTVIVRLILFPISKKAAKTQIEMRRIEPELKSIREKHKDDKQAQALQTLALYKEKGINPFSSIALMFIQLPILIALYQIFLRSGLPSVKTESLYAFVDVPTITMEFLGFINVSDKNLWLAVIAGIAQYYQVKLTLPSSPKKEGVLSFQDQMARSLQMQMKYVLPIFIAFIAYQFSAVIAIYFIISSLFMIGQELYVKRDLENKAQ
jgi:YidC/Oxa1 family membrane protein insertase